MSSVSPIRSAAVRNEENKCCKLLLKIQKLCDRIEKEAQRKGDTLLKISRQKKEVKKQLSKVALENKYHQSVISSQNPKAAIAHKKMMETIDKTNKAALEALALTYGPILTALQQQIITIEHEKQKFLNSVHEAAVKVQTDRPEEVRPKRDGLYTSESKVTNSELQEVKSSLQQVSTFSTEKTGSEPVVLNKVNLPPRLGNSHSERFAQQLADAEKRLNSRVVQNSGVVHEQSASLSKSAISQSKTQSFLTVDRQKHPEKSKNDLFIDIKGDSADLTSVGSRKVPPKKDFRLPVPQCLSPSSMDNANTSRMDPEFEPAHKPQQNANNNQAVHRSEEANRNPKVVGSFVEGNNASGVTKKRRVSQPHEAIDCIQNLMLRFQELVPKQ